MQTEGSSAFHTDEPFKDHHGIIALVKHWAEDKYLGFTWRDEPTWGTLLTGGIEEGAGPEDTVRRELLEETGYKDIKFLTHLTTVHSKYYHVPKKLNRFAHAPVYVVELGSDAQDPVAPEEKDRHGLRWLTAVELKSFLTAESHQLAIKLLAGDVYTDSGVLANSGEFSGMDSEEAKKKITEFAGGKVTVNYKLRDWVFSRQRYWGEPIPIIHCPNHGAVAVPEDQLPVLLPEVESYEPSGTGESPLANIAEWVNTTCPTCGGPAKRETNTMPQWAGSSWYYLRFMDPHNVDALVGKDKEKYWAPVDVYVGGDHAVRHLIYARFWHKFLYDVGSVSTVEPFARLEFLGFILAEDGRKMSKRYGNVINPNDVVSEHGADAFRVYEMFMGPFENTIAWSTKNLVGSRRFIERIWKLQEIIQETDEESLSELLNQTILKVTEDIGKFKFNTAISQMMIFLKTAEAYHSVSKNSIGKNQFETFLKLLAPFAPHITEELWQAAGHKDSIHIAPWPVADESKLAASTATIAVQVNGKVRGTVELAESASESDALSAGRAAVGKWLDPFDKAQGKGARVVYLPGKIINFVYPEL